MSATPQTLRDFVKACQRRFGRDAAYVSDDGAFVLLKEAAVQLRLDPDSDRVAFWTDLAMPAGASIEVIEQAAADYVADRFLDSGYVIGVSRDACLVALGRSCESQLLRAQEAFELVEALEREAVAAAGRIKTALGEAARAFAQIPADELLIHDCGRSATEIFR